jgi:hypothetical protein
MFSFKVLSWFALVASICFLVLTILQVLELNYYGATPSLWQ